MAALRRAGRGALVMPAMFAFGTEVLRNPTVATFAAFGSFALLLLVDFGGPLRARLQAQAALAATGAVFICVGTVVSRSAWLGALAMGLVGFGVLFAGVVSSVLASATVALLLAFILPVALPGPLSSIPDRLAGWGLAAAASFAAISLLWPAPTREPLRGAAITACRALAARLRTEARFLLGGAGAPSVDERDESIERADAAVAGLHRTFFRTPYRPTGLSTSARAVVRLVDEIGWLNAIVVQKPRSAEGLTVDGAACAVRAAAATLLDRGADLLEEPGRPTEQLDRARAKLDDSPGGARADELGAPPAAGTADGVAGGDRMHELVSALDPGFRAQELSFAASQIASNIELAAAAERRTWMERLLGRRPAGLVGPLASAQERAAAHVQRHSVWLHNSVRGAIGLALAVLVANLAGVQHSFWVVLGTLSVLRSNALSTGQNVVRGLVGTAAGFVVGARAAGAGRHRHDAALVAAPGRGAVRRLRPGGDLVRRRSGRVHAHAGHPLQHPGAVGLAGGAAARRGHRDRLRREPRGRRPPLAAGRRRARSARRSPTRTRAARTSSRQPFRFGIGIVRHRVGAAGCADRRVVRGRGGVAAPRRRISAASSPSAARSRFRSPM